MARDITTTNTNGAVKFVDANDGSWVKGTRQNDGFALANGDRVHIYGSSNNHLFDVEYTEFSTPDGATLGSAAAVEAALNTSPFFLTSSGGGSSDGSFTIVVTDENLDISTGTGLMPFPMPYDMTLTGIRSYLTTAPTGTGTTIDVNLNGTSIMTTHKLDHASASKTDDETAVLTTTALSELDEITVDIDSVAATPGKGLRIVLIGTKS